MLPGAARPGGRRYGGRTQLAAAEAFLRANRARTALVTVSIGGNDVTACAQTPGADRRASCRRSQTAGRNVLEAARRLRRAAGPRVRIVGTTYPDVLLGLYARRRPGRAEPRRADRHGVQDVHRPDARGARTRRRAAVRRRDRGLGRLHPAGPDDDAAPYGTVPVAVARTCELTYYCAFRDIHARTDGYRLIAELVARTLPRR